VNEPARVEIEQQKYLSALPFLPPLTEKSLTTYYTIYGAFFGAVILFGGLLAPLLEVRIGVGGESWSVVTTRCLFLHMLPAVAASGLCMGIQRQT
jgi:hypothetical protein